MVNLSHAQIQSDDAAANARRSESGGTVAAARGSGRRVGGAPERMPNCNTGCGNISVPYPFGISPGCYLSGFDLTCDTSHNPPRLLLATGTTPLEVLSISLDDSTMRVSVPYINVTGNVADGETANGTWGGPDWGLADGGPYVLSAAHNEFILIGCHLFAELLMVFLGRDRITKKDIVINSCGTVCDVLGPLDFAKMEPMAARTDMYSWPRCKKQCTGNRCCQATLPFGQSAYTVRLKLLPLLQKWFPEAGHV
ncbi:hypothetical protein ACP4OV_017765 [Aristida adscensionis]